jgi:RNA polymerase sigma-70 factor (ECF subfamily)
MSSEISSSQSPGLFPHTRWSVVLSAREQRSPESTEALEALCRTYWYPLYAFVRGCGRSPHDAQDLTQEFFARLLSKQWLRLADPEKGRFRTFLRVALRRFLADDWDRARAQKRGGGQTPVSFDTALAEQRFLSERAGAGSPDRLYERRWALALLDQAMSRLEQEYGRAGKASELAHLKPHLTAERGAIPYADIAAALQTSEGAARVAVHRLRKCFREIFREVIADTVSNADEVDAEARHVLEALSCG